MKRQINRIETRVKKKEQTEHLIFLNLFMALSMIKRLYRGERARVSLSIKFTEDIRRIRANV